jgi:hypothetical protein
MMDEFSGETPDIIADRTYALAKLVEALKGVEKGSPLLTLGLAHIKAVTTSIPNQERGKAPVLSMVRGGVN